jgi:hypothetical protein
MRRLEEGKKGDEGDGRRRRREAWKMEEWKKGDGRNGGWRNGRWGMEDGEWKKGGGRQRRRETKETEETGGMEDGGMEVAQCFFKRNGSIGRLNLERT